MNERLRRLLAERASVWARMQEIRDRATNDDNRDLTAEERQNWDEAEARLSELTGDIEREQRGDSIQRDLEQIVLPQLPDAALRSNGGEEPEARRYEQAFEAYVRRGAGDLTAEQRSLLASRYVGADGETRALSASTTTAGGYTVPPGFRDTIIEQQRWFGSVRSVATNINTDAGNPLQWPTFNGTAQVGRILAENTQLTQTDPVFGTTTLGAYMYSSDLVLVPYQFLQDTNLNAEEFLARNLGIRIGRIQNAHFTTGTGTSQPLGIQTNATAGFTMPTGNTTSITYAGLVNLMHSVDVAYRYGGNAAWMLSDSALMAIRLLVDSQNRPLWEPSVQAGMPDTLLGFPIVVNNDMPAPAASVKSVLFGDFRRGYVVRDVLDVQVRRLDERYADFLQVGWFGFARADGTVQDSAAYKALVQSAT